MAANGSELYAVTPSRFPLRKDNTFVSIIYHRSKNFSSGWDGRKARVMECYFFDHSIYWLQRYMVITFVLNYASLMSHNGSELYAVTPSRFPQCKDNTFVSIIYHCAKNFSSGRDGRKSDVIWRCFFDHSIY